MNTTEYVQLFNSRSELKAYLTSAIEELYGKYPLDPQSDRSQAGAWLDTHLTEAIEIARRKCFDDLAAGIFNNSRLQTELTEVMCKRVYERLREKN